MANQFLTGLLILLLVAAIFFLVYLGTLITNLKRSLREWALFLGDLRKKIFPVADQINELIIKTQNWGERVGSKVKSGGTFWDIAFILFKGKRQVLRNFLYPLFFTLGLGVLEKMLKKTKK